MSKITQLAIAGTFAAAFMIGAAGYAGAAGPAGATKGWMPTESSDVTLVHRRPWRHGHRHHWRGYHPHGYWYGHPRRYGGYGWRGPRFGFYYGPRYRHWY